MCLLSVFSLLCLSSGESAPLHPPPRLRLGRSHLASRWLSECWAHGNAALKGPQSAAARLAPALCSASFQSGVHQFAGRPSSVHGGDTGLAAGEKKHAVTRDSPAARGASSNTARHDASTAAGIWLVFRDEGAPPSDISLPCLAHYFKGWSEISSMRHL